MDKLKSQIPQVKVAAGGMAGGVAIVIVLIVESIWPDLTNELGTAIFVVAVTSIAAWGIPDPPPWNKPE